MKVFNESRIKFVSNDLWNVSKTNNAAPKWKVHGSMACLEPTQAGHASDCHGNCTWSTVSLRLLAHLMMLLSLMKVCVWPRTPPSTLSTRCSTDEGEGAGLLRAGGQHIRLVWCAHQHHIIQRKCSLSWCIATNINVITNYECDIS